MAVIYSYEVTLQVCSNVHSVAVHLLRLDAFSVMGVVKSCDRSVVRL